MGDARLNITDGRFYIHPTPGTARPVDTADSALLADGWVGVGETHVDERFTPVREGGEKIILATLQNRSARVRRSRVSNSFTLVIVQLVQESWKLYYGANAIVAGDGSVGPAPTPVPTECAFLAVFDDGDQTFSVHVSFASVIGSDVMNMGDDESFAGLPIEIDCLQSAPGVPDHTVSPLVDSASVVSWMTAANAFASALEVGEPFFAQITASGVGTYSVTAGALPAGMGLSSSGLLYGSPDTAGAFSFTVTKGASTRTFTGTVAA